MSTLADKIAALKANQPMTTCYTKHQAPSHGHNIEFFPSLKCPDEAVGFSSSLLQRYTLEANPKAADSADAPPQRLTLAFPTDDVVIYGWNLTLLRECLRDQKLESVSALSDRYAGASTPEPWISKIEFVLVGKS